jgi:archaellum component FlaC
MAMNVEAEIRDLKRRVGELEGSFGFLMEQVKGIHRDLLGFQEMTEQRFDGIEGRLGRVEGKLDGVGGRLGRVETEVRGLREDLPEIVGDAVRSVLRPGDR